MKTKLFNPFHYHNPEEDFKEICEWIDAGVFSGDLLHCVDLNEFKDYIARWQLAVTNHIEANNES